MKLHLQLTLDQLGPSYQADKPYYSLMISAALEPETGETITDDLVSKFLRVWSWETFPALSVYGRPKNSSQPWKELEKEIVTETEPAGIDALRQALAGELSSQLKSFKADEFIWTPTPQQNGIETKPINTAADPRSGRDWRAFLAHVATYPGGLGIHLRLCLYFFLKQKPAEGTIVLAAPIIRIPYVDGGGTAQVIVAEPMDPADSGNPLQSITVPNTDPESLFQWQYKTAEAGLKVDAFVNAPKPVANDDKSFINIQTLWRNKATLGPSVDWLAQLQDAVAPALNLPDQITRFLRKLETSAPPAGIKVMFQRALWEFILPAVDVERVPPQSRSLLQSILFRFAQSSDFNFTTSVPTGWEPDVPDPAGTSAEYARKLEEHWQTFTGNDALTAKIVVLWHDAFRGPASQWPAIKQSVTPLLQETVLASRLPVHNVGLFWTKLFPAGKTGIGEEKKDIKKRLQDEVVVFAKNALSIIDSGLEKILRDHAGAAFDQSEQQLTGDATSDGITVQVDKVDATDGIGTETDHADYLRQISGAGVLLRRDSSSEWRFLNLAQIRVRGATAPMPKPVAAPVRFQYAAGVRQPFLTYQNQPLIAQSPWARMAPTREAQDLTPFPRDLSALLSYDSPYNAQSTLKLERLTYGVTYQAAVFYVGNAGNLPAQIADSVSGTVLPWRFKIPGKDDPQGTVTIHYKRRCPVGLLRTAQDPAVNSRAFPPVLPEDVFPLTRSLKEIEKPNEVESKRAPERHPLVVLLPSNRPAGMWDENNASSQATFLLRPPAVDLKVWDRWVSEDAAMRKAVLTEAFQLLNDKALGRRAQEDPTVDDPAVGGFTVSFSRLFPTSQEVSVATSFDFGPAKGNRGLASQQRTGRIIAIESAAVGVPNANLPNNQVRIQIPDGEVWTVRFTPVIQEADRFDIPANQLTAPFSIDVEVAMPLFTGANQLDRNKALHDAILISPACGKPPDLEITDAVPEDQVRLELSGASIKDFQHLVYKTDLLAQRWRWDGRPVYEDPTAKELRSGLPFAKLEEPPADFTGDGMLFADRADSDYTVIPGFVDLASVDPIKLLHTLKVTGLPAVLYYRFAVRAYSRYQGLLVRQHLLDSNVAGGATARRWKRHILPLRWRERVPKPLIKLVVPVTETPGGKDAATVTPGWLVMLEESWFDERMAGLGECLETEILKVSLPDDPSSTRYEFGPDPVIDMTEDPLAGHEPTTMRLLGPVGLTFDTDSSVPLFIRSSFFLPAPVIPGQEKRDLSFHFVKLRFRRVLLGSDDQNPRGSRMEGPWTDPFWVQVLPPANRWKLTKNQATIWAHSDELSIAPDGKSVLYRGAKADLQPVSQDIGFVSFRLYALVTRRVFDAFGRADQESFLSFTALDAIPVPEKGSEPELLLRIVEVQFRSQVDTAGNRVLIGNVPIPSDFAGLLETLFPKHATYSLTSPPDQDAKGRIVRISPSLRIG